MRVSLEMLRTLDWVESQTSPFVEVPEIITHPGPENRASTTVGQAATGRSRSSFRVDGSGGSSLAGDWPDLLIASFADRSRHPGKLSIYLQNRQLRRPMKNGQGRAILSVPFERSDFYERAHFSIIERRNRSIETAILFRRTQAGRCPTDY